MNNSFFVFLYILRKLSDTVVLTQNIIMPKRVGSGRKTVAVAKLFKDVISTSKIAKVECTFCSKNLAKNGSRMLKHIQNCKKCPNSVKGKYKQSTTAVSEKRAEKQESSGASPFTSTKSKISGSITSFVDKMNPADQDKADELLSRAIYASRAPLCMMDNTCWKDFFSFLRPAYKIPSRYMLSVPFLEREYQNVSTMVAEAIANANSVGLAADGWSNVRNEPIVNFVVTTPKPFLYKVLPTGKSSHTGEYMAHEMSCVIDEIGQQKIFGLVTDNAANMKSTWRLLEAKYEETNLFTYGCLAHCIQLIFNDLKKMSSLKTLKANAVACIKTIKNSHKLNAAFIEKQSSTGVKVSLKYPVKTRWASLFSCLESLKDNKQTIRAMAIEEDLSDALSKVNTVKKLMLSDDFWDKVTGFSDLLKPIAETIKIVESDTPQLSHVLSLYKKLEEEVIQKIDQSPLSVSEVNKVKEILKHRKEFAIYDVHKISNLLDPQFKGCDLSPDDESLATEKIYNAAVKIPDIDEDRVLAELANYIAKEGFFSKTFLWSAVSKLTPLAWWAGLCKSTALSKVAVRFLALPTTSAAVERTFSTYSDVHSKKRNRLTNERAGKIVYIAHNLKLQSQNRLPAIQKEPEKETVMDMDNIIDLDETEEEPENSDADRTSVDTDSTADSSSE